MQAAARLHLACDGGKIGRPQVAPRHANQFTVLERDVRAVQRRETLDRGSILCCIGPRHRLLESRVQLLRIAVLHFQHLDFRPFGRAQPRAQPREDALLFVGGVKGSARVEVSEAALYGFERLGRPRFQAGAGSLQSREAFLDAAVARNQVLQRMVDRAAGALFAPRNT